MIIAAWFFLSLQSPRALAGQEVGNGGNAVICPKPHPSVEMLDLAEARLLRGSRFTTKAPASSGNDWAIEQIKRLKAVDPVLAARLQQSLNGFPGNFQFLPDADLSSIPDSLHLALPQGCSIKQLAIRKREIKAGEARFLVDQALWSRLDARSQGALLLHELIYDDFIQQNPASVHDSRQARELNALIWSDDFQTISSSDYVRAVSSLSELRTSFQIDGMEFRSGGESALELYPNGHVRKGRLTTPEVELKVGANRYRFSNPNGPLELEFYASGVPKSGWLNQPTTVHVANRSVTVEYLVQFTESGQISHASSVNGDGNVLEEIKEIP